MSLALLRQSTCRSTLNNECRVSSTQYIPSPSTCCPTPQWLAACTMHFVPLPWPWVFVFNATQNLNGLSEQTWRVAGSVTSASKHALHVIRGRDYSIAENECEERLLLIGVIDLETSECGHNSNCWRITSLKDGESAALGQRRPRQHWHAADNVQDICARPDRHREPASDTWECGAGETCG